MLGFRLLRCGKYDNSHRQQFNGTPFLRGRQRTPEKPVQEAHRLGIAHRRTSSSNSSATRSSFCGRTSWAPRARRWSGRPAHTTRQCRRPAAPRRRGRGTPGRPPAPPRLPATSAGPVACAAAVAPEVDGGRVSGCSCRRQEAQRSIPQRIFDIGLQCVVHALCHRLFRSLKSGLRAFSWDKERAHQGPGASRPTVTPKCPPTHLLVAQHGVQDGHAEDVHLPAHVGRQRNGALKARRVDCQQACESRCAGLLAGRVWARRV